MKMRTLIVYYSLDGNTELIAQLIANDIEAVKLKIQPIKEIPTKGFMKYFWGGKSVVFNELPKIVYPIIDVNDFDCIYIGTPIWNNSYAPPLSTFFQENKIEGKEMVLFACHGGGGAKKAFERLTKILENNHIIKTMEFKDPLTQNRDEVIKQLNVQLQKERD